MALQAGKGHGIDGAQPVGTGREVRTAAQGVSSIGSRFEFPAVVTGVAEIRSLRLRPQQGTAGAVKLMATAALERSFRPRRKGCGQGPGNGNTLRMPGKSCLAMAVSAGSASPVSPVVRTGLTVVARAAFQVGMRRSCCRHRPHRSRSGKRSKNRRCQTAGEDECQVRAKSPQPRDLAFPNKILQDLVFTPLEINYPGSMIGEFK